MQAWLASPFLEILAEKLALSPSSLGASKSISYVCAGGAGRARLSKQVALVPLGFQDGQVFATQRCFVLDCRHILLFAYVPQRGQTATAFDGGWARMRNALSFTSTLS